MNTCVIIPTFWARRRERLSNRLINVYDHPTPIDQDGTLPACLRSLEQAEGIDRVVVLVAVTDPSIEHDAEDRVNEILDKTTENLEAFVFGPAEQGSLHRRLEQLEFADMIPGVTLTGYGAVRNVGLLVAATLGAEAAVFIDDDAVAADTGFLKKGLEGLGMRTPDGRVVLAKSGYYLDAAEQWMKEDDSIWADAFWKTAVEYNRGMSIVHTPPRLKPSNMAFGGCLALHKEMYTNVSFDPWIVRGEDMDYVVNARMHGGDVFIDNGWSVIHRPPERPSHAVALRQDAYRFVYEHRKLEFAKSQVDLRQVSPNSLRPYPGEFVGGGIAWRAFATALMHAATFKESGDFLSVAKAALTDAGKYARRNCDNYFAFQRRWPLLMQSVWEDVALGSLFSGERSVDRSAITGRFPAVESEG